MSHFSKAELTINDQDSLVAALRELGYQEVEVHATPQHLYGYHGDLRPETAHVIVRRRFVGQSSNDLGFVRGQDGRYVAIVSEYDRSHHDDAWLRQVTKLAGVHRVLKEAKARGLTAERRTDARGRLQVVVTGRWR